MTQKRVEAALASLRCVKRFKPSRATPSRLSNLGAYWNEAGRLTHQKHHKHANDPEPDPDINTRSDGAWHMAATNREHGPPHEMEPCRRLQVVEAAARRAMAAA